MKSGGPNCGNFKLHGRRTARLSCGCCVAENFKWSERLREAGQEIVSPDAPWEIDLLAAELAYFEEGIDWAAQPVRRWEFPASGKGIAFSLP